MYKVKVTELRGRRSNTKIYEFCGEITEQVRQQWEKIKKNAVTPMTFEFLSYSFDNKGKSNDAANV